jgi:hypothetical protein
MGALVAINGQIPAYRQAGFDCVNRYRDFTSLRMTDFIGAIAGGNKSQA